MKYKQEQYDIIKHLVNNRMGDLPLNHIILHYKWFSLASNIHNNELVKIIINDIVKEIEEERRDD